METDLQKEFYELFQLLGGYLNEDFSYYGPTLEDAVATYINEASVETISAARADIARFLDRMANDLDAQLERLCWGYSREPGMGARDYLLWLDGLLAEGLTQKAGRG